MRVLVNSERCVICKQEIDFKVHALYVYDPTGRGKDPFCKPCFDREWKKSKERKKQRSEITYRVKTMLDAGLEAHWKKTQHGKPYIAVRKPGERNWWICDVAMFNTMQREGVMAGYESATVLGDIFSIAVR